MTLAERVADAQQRSVSAYLQRQRVEQMAQQARMQAQAIDAELLALDGELRVLTALMAEAAHGQ